MRASIVITTYNQAVILECILNSLLCQDTAYDFEIIVCDDGGEGDTYNIVSRLRSNKKGIKLSYYWQQDRRFRAASARNMGIAAAMGKIVILLDGDMVPRADFVQKHVEYHLNNTRSILSGGRLTIDDSDFFECSKVKRNPYETLRCIDRKSFINTEELEFRKVWYQGDKPWMAMFSCNLSFPKSDYSKYSELFIGWGIEDWDISLRLFKQNYKIHFDKNIIAYHVDYKPVISNAFRNNDHVQMVEFARNLLLFIDQYPEIDLSECAIALRSYQIYSSRLQWAGDGKKLRSAQRGIELLRVWLSDNNIYNKGEPFYVEREYKNTKLLSEFNKKTLNSIRVLDGTCDQVVLNFNGIKPNDLAEVTALANKLKSMVKIIC